MTIESTDIWYPRLRIQALTTKGPEPMEAEEVLRLGVLKGTGWTRWTWWTWWRIVR